MMLRFLSKDGLSICYRLRPSLSGVQSIWCSGSALGQVGKMCESDIGSWDALFVKTFIRVRIVVTLSQRKSKTLSLAPSWNRSRASSPHGLFDFMFRYGGCCGGHASHGRHGGHGTRGDASKREGRPSSHSTVLYDSKDPVFRHGRFWAAIAVSIEGASTGSVPKRVRTGSITMRISMRVKSVERAEDESQSPTGSLAPTYRRHCAASDGCPVQRCR